MRRPSLKHTLLLSSALILLAACGGKEAAEPVAPAETEVTDAMADKASEVKMANPLLQSWWDTPFGIPPFSMIKDEHFMPAFEEGIVELEGEIEAIIQNKAEPTFDNTIKALEVAGKKLSRVQSVFGNITNTDTNDTLQEMEAEIWPRLSQVYDGIVLNDSLWQKVNALYESRDTLGLDKQQLRVLELYHRDFVRSGASLDADAKARMKEINAELSELTTSFGQNLLAETKDFTLQITDEAKLSGLPKGLIDSAKKTAEGKGLEGWVFGLNRSVYESFMTYADDRDLREKLFNGYRLRAANGGDSDNGENILRIARLRAEAARLRGYESHAHFQLETRMAKTPAQAEEFLLQVWRPGLAKAKAELTEMAAIVAASDEPYEIAGHDWWYLSEKVRQQKYAFDDAELKPYFELSNVLQGAFHMAEKLWGITFSVIEDAPLWNPEVTAYELKDADGTHLGVFMIDMYARDSKRGGAWMSTYRSASNLDGNNIRPIATNNLNLVKPAAEGDPTLMSFNEVSTLFHEFGHGLHGLLTTQRYERISGVGGPRDYTEFPAQMLEHWAPEPEMLNVYATHYETGEVIPQALIEKMKTASNYNQGFKTTEYVAASLLDLAWHNLNEEEAAAITDAREFEKQVLAEYGLIDEIEPRYRSPYFSHIFAGGYSAGYYAYLWSEILDSDGFAAFEEKGDIFDEELAQKLRTHIYEAGASEPADELYRKFRGKDPSIEPLLRNRGFTDGS